MKKMILSTIFIVLAAIAFTGCAVYPGRGYGYGSQPYYGGYPNYGYERGYRNYGGYGGGGYYYTQRGHYHRRHDDDD